MRRFYTCNRIEREEPGARRVLVKPVDDLATLSGYRMGLGNSALLTPEAFLQKHGSDWIMELHTALKELLSKDRVVLGIGSGECEHEVRLFLEGYQVTGSDLLPAAFAHTARLFPQFKARAVDILRPPPSERFDDILITGIEAFFDAAQLGLIINNVRQLLKPGGRLIFVLRRKDNFATWAVDYLGIPLTCLGKQVAGFLGLVPGVFRLEFAGYRRTQHEVVTLARRAGFRLGRKRFAGFGVELLRLGLRRALPSAYEFIRRLDRRLCWFNNATVFEFLT